jgi:transposase
MRSGWRTGLAPWPATRQLHSPAAAREVCALTRYRQALAHARTQEVNRLHKLLETANLTLGAVATDVLGASGREMLEAILAILSGEERSEQLAELARWRLRAKLPQLHPGAQGLEGRIQAQRRVLLRHVLAHIDFIKHFIEQQLQQLTGGDRGGAHAHDQRHRATRDHSLHRAHDGGRHHRGN